MNVKASITVEELFSKGAIWIPRVNGIQEEPLTGIDVKSLYDTEEFTVHNDRISFHKLGPSLRDFQFIFSMNELVVGKIETGSVIEARNLPIELMQQIYAGEIIDSTQCTMLSGKIFREFTFMDGSIALYLNDYPINIKKEHDT